MTQERAPNRQQENPNQIKQTSGGRCLFEDSQPSLSPSFRKKTHPFPSNQHKENILFRSAKPGAPRNIANAVRLHDGCLPTQRVGWTIPYRASSEQLDTQTNIRYIRSKIWASEHEKPRFPLKKTHLKNTEF